MQELDQMIREFLGLKSHKLIHLNHVLSFFIHNISRKALHYEEIINRWNLKETRFDKQTETLYEYILQEYQKEKNVTTRIVQN